MSSDPFDPISIFAGGKYRLLSQRVLLRILERSISVEWIALTIEHPVAIVIDDRKNSTNYFGVVENRSRLLKVAVSREDDRIIATVHFDTGATRRHQRGEL